MMPRCLRPSGHWVTVFLVGAMVVLATANVVGLLTPGVRVEVEMDQIEDCWCYEVSPGVTAETCVSTDIDDYKDFAAAQAAHDQRVSARMAVKPAVSCN